MSNVDHVMGFPSQPHDYQYPTDRLIVSIEYNFRLSLLRCRNSAGKVESVEADPNLENKDYKKTTKLTWLADTSSAPLLPCVCVYFDYIISKSTLGKDEDFKDFVNPVTKVS